MKLIRSLPVVLGALVAAASCSPASNTPSGATNKGGNSGSGGATATGGTAGGSGGSAGSGGTVGGSGGSGSGGSGSGGATPPVGSGGASGSGGSDGGTSADVAKDATAPDGTAAGFTKQWSCPPEPLPNEMVGPSMAVCQGFQYANNYNEGPTWIASENAFFFSNFNRGSGAKGDIIKFSMDTKQCELFIKDAGCNGLAVHANGQLIGACHTSASIIEFDLKTKARRTIAGMYMGKKFDSPNDLVAHSNGTIYFSNPNYEALAPGFGEATFRIDPMGTVSVIAMGRSNGIALSPDERKLYVVGAGTWDLDANGVPGTRSGGGPGGDGLSVNCKGGVFGRGTNSAYGGADGKTILTVSGGTGASISQSNIPGLP